MSNSMKKYLPHLVSFVVGFVSLSMEILWIRMMGFASGAIPRVFALVLAVYLVGIAVGSNIGKNLCQKERDFWKLLAQILALAVFSNIIGVLMLIFVFEASGDEKPWGLAALLIFQSAMTMAIVFPIVHHLSGDQVKAKLGRSVSLVYGANILGSATGPLVVCFGLLTFLGTQQSIIILQVTLFVAAILCLFASNQRPIRRYQYGGGLVLCIGVLLAATFYMNESVIYGLSSAFEGKLPSKIIETNRGIVTAYKRAVGGDVVCGGNIYDGSMNLDPVNNANHIDRILITGALVDHPKRVLVIGLSGGSWLSLVLTFPGVEWVDVVEINNGYLSLINDYPPQRASLADPRVHLYITDGAKWLREHQEGQYDLVVMNTTFHWRNYAANLLSVEMMELLRSRMTPQAVLTFNTTDSVDAIATAASVFPHTYLRVNFVIASRSDFLASYDEEKAKQKLLSLNMDGKPLYYDGSEGAAAQHVKIPFVTLAEAKKRLNRAPEIITRDNMLTEYKYGK